MCITLIFTDIYRQISNIGHTHAQKFNVFRHVLQLSLIKLLMPGIKLRMKV